MLNKIFYKNLKSVSGVEVEGGLGSPWGPVWDCCSGGIAPAPSCCPGVGFRLFLVTVKLRQRKVSREETRPESEDRDAAEPVGGPAGTSHPAPARAPGLSGLVSASEWL